VCIGITTKPIHRFRNLTQETNSVIAYLFATEKRHIREALRKEVHPYFVCEQPIFDCVDFRE